MTFFVNKSMIKEVVISDSVTFIYSRALFNCTNLTSINIQKSVVTIENMRFITVNRLRTSQYQTQ